MRAARDAAGPAPSPPAGRDTRSLLVQRKCACGGGSASASASASACACDERQDALQRLAVPGASTSGPGAVGGPAASAATGGAGGFLVDDDAVAGPGQMRKSDFIAVLRPAVQAAADAELAHVGRDTQGCPYLDRWFAYYSQRDAAHGERTLRRFAPQTAAATSAADYVPIVAERVRRSVAHWAGTGELPGALSEGLGADGLGALGGVAGVMGDGAGGVGGAVAGALGRVGGVFGAVAGAVTGAVAGAGALLGKGARDPDRADPVAVRSELRAGAPLPTSTRTRMEQAFGHDFSQVRVHTDATAASLARGLHARAFTVGTDVAFAPGEWQPGTVVGDAVVAHELAHVVQQASGSVSGASLAGGARQALEDDADRAAAGAVASSWGMGHDGVVPRLRSGLRLQRCGAGQQSARPSPAPPVAPPVADPGINVVANPPRGVPVDAGGFAHCNERTGQYELGVLASAPRCLHTSIWAHEQAHATFNADRCRRHAAAYRELEDAMAAARANPNDATLTRAERAEAQLRAITQEWAATCAEDERQAYRAGLAVMAEGPVQERCQADGQANAFSQARSVALAISTGRVRAPNCPPPAPAQPAPAQPAQPQPTP